jgi:predicted phosphodiesterase
VARTDAEGRYELVSDVSRPFVSCSVPSGFEVERNPTGTARFYQPLTPGSREVSAAFELRRREGSDEEHAMLLLPDVQTQSPWEMERFHEQTVPDVIETVRSLGDLDVFGVACGDIMYDDLSLYPEYERAVARIGVPFFQVVGNHDLDFDGETDEAATRTFSRHFGPRYYSFDRGAARYVVLDDVFYHGAGYIGYVQDAQLRWLEAELEDLAPGAPVIVALHIPVRGTRHAREGLESPTVSGSVTNREALYRILEPFEAHVVSGHTHENDHNWHGGVHEHVSGTVCGAWWSGPICGDGTPNGYSVYEVNGEEVRWRYKSTGHAPHHQMRAYLPGADPAAPQELIANVWDADEGWTVDWYEDGERRGRMARRIGRDPVSLRIHSGEQLPPRRAWVDPYPRYLYYAPVSSTASEIRVEATDRFGRKYMAVAGPVPEDLRAWDREEEG